jgi:hypothetical protein
VSSQPVVQPVPVYMDARLRAQYVLKPLCLFMLQKNDIKVLLVPVVPISEAQGSASKSDGHLNGRITRSVGHFCASCSMNPFLYALRPHHQPCIGWQLGH